MAIQLALIPGAPKLKRQSLRYFGAKWKLAKWIIGHFPTCELYHESYCGSASLGAQMLPAPREIYNDLNESTINFLRVLQTQPDELVAALRNTPVTPDEFAGCFQRSDDPLEFARRTACLSWGGYMGAGGRWSGGCTTSRLERMTQMDWQFLYPLSDRFQNAIFQQGDAIASLLAYDSPTTLHYVDPPYLGDVRGSQDKRTDSGRPCRQYAHEMLDHDAHIRLGEVLNQLRGKVVLSGRPHPLYDEQLFSGWRRVDTITHDSDRRKCIESIWMNY